MSKMQNLPDEVRKLEEYFSGNVMPEHDDEWIVDTAAELTRIMAKYESQPEPESGKFNPDYGDDPEVLKGVIRDLIEAAKGGNWISVKDRLPENYVEVLAWGQTAERFPFCSVAEIDGSGVWNSAGYELDTITHWQPLPEPPVTKKEADDDTE